MPERGRISVLQLSLILLIIRTIVPVLYVSSVTVARRDAWVAEIAVGLGNQLVLWLFLVIAMRFPGQSLTAILRQVLGRTLGGLFSLIYGLYFLHYCSEVLRSFGEFMATTIMPQTPLSVVMLAMGLVAAYCAHKGIEIIGRSSEMLFPIIAVGMGLVVLLVLNQARPTRLLPVMDQGVGPVLLSVARSSLVFTEAPFFPSAFALLHNRKGLSITLHTMFAVISISIAFITAVVVATEGDDLAAATTYAIFGLARLATVGEFFDRIEPLFMTTVVMGYAIRITVFLYAGALTLAEVFGLQSYQPLVLALMSTAVTLALIQWENTIHMLEYFGTAGPLLAWVMILVFPIILLLVAMMRGMPRECPRGRES